MEENELNEHLRTINDRIYEQLSYAEAKNAVLMGFVGAAIFSIIGIIIDLHELNLQWLQIWLGVIAGTLLIPFILSLTSFYPNMRTSNRNREHNLFFYGDIANFKNAKAYIDNINNDKSLNEQLAEQNIMVSNIVTKKHKKFSMSLHFAFASIFPIHYIGVVIILIKSRKNK